MEKVGRNQLCPCGSGKKYKKCHGNGGESANAAARPKRLTARLPWSGIPGLQQQITFVPQYGDPADPKNAHTPQGMPGQYDIVFTFSRPGYSIDGERNVTASEFLQGNSHLAITRPANTLIGPSANKWKIDVTVFGKPFQFEGFPNPTCFLSKIAGRVSAQNSRDAYKIAMSALTPSLSSLSAQLDIPLFIFQADITEVATGTHSIIRATPFPDTPLVNIPGTGLSSEMRGYASLYRESLNSSSPIYQFLCFFKILEGTRQRRQRLGKEARSCGQTIARPPEVFPRTVSELKPWLDALYLVRPLVWEATVIDSLLLPEIAGRKFGWIIDTIFTPLRDQIAHVLL